MPEQDHERILFDALRGIGEKAAALTPEETVVVEDVAHDPPVPEAHVAAPAGGKVTAANLFRNPEAHPLALDLALLTRYGVAWLGWEPETLEATLPGDFHVQNVSDVALTKINACKTLHLVDSFWERWEVFVWCTMALNGIFPDAQMMQVPTVGQVLVAVDIANRIREDVPWAEEVRLFIETVLRHDGVLVPLPPIGFVRPVGDAKVVAEIEAAWGKVRAEGHAPEGDTLVAEQLRRMLSVHQFLEESRTRLHQQLELVAHV